MSKWCFTVYTLYLQSLFSHYNPLLSKGVTVIWMQGEIEAPRGKITWPTLTLLVSGRIWTQGKILCPSHVLYLPHLFFFFLSLCICFERESAPERVKGQREGERETPTHEPWDHDLSWNQESFNWPSHPGAQPHLRSTIHQEARIGSWLRAWARESDCLGLNLTNRVVLGTSATLRCLSLLSYKAEVIISAPRDPWKIPSQSLPPPLSFSLFIICCTVIFICEPEWFVKLSPGDLGTTKLRPFHSQEGSFASCD